MLGDPFDPNAEFLIEETCKPHWSQAGAVVFVTFRTHDSIPLDVISLWEQQKQDWLERRGITGVHWKEALPFLSENIRSHFNIEFNRTREEFLDTCHGECLLRRPALATIVSDTLLHFDRIRYRMGDLIVMPNHAHLMCVFSD